jgi:hypothetical protein
LFQGHEKLGTLYDLFKVVNVPRRTELFTDGGGETRQKLVSEQLLLRGYICVWHCSLQKSFQGVKKH